MDHGFHSLPLPLSLSISGSYDLGPLSSVDHTTSASASALSLYLGLMTSDRLLLWIMGFIVFRFRSIRSYDLSLGLMTSDRLLYIVFCFCFCFRFRSIRSYDLSPTSNFNHGSNGLPLPLRFVIYPDLMILDCLLLGAHGLPLPLRFVIYLDLMILDCLLLLIMGLMVFRFI